MRVALLTAANLIPDAPDRRADAWQFDVQMNILKPAFAAEGLSLEPVGWLREAGWEEFDAALVLTAWDYQDRPEAFLARIDALQALGVAVHNTPDLVRWNIRKTYLRELEARGVAVIPTLWPEAPMRADVEAAFEAFATDRVVLKRQVGAGARGQQSFARGEAVVEGPLLDRPLLDRPLLDRPGMIQPFMRAIAEEGEYSFLFVDGALSHVLVKRAAAGEYRIQAAYGGVSATVRPTAADQAQATAVLAALDAMPAFRGQPPLYARIDMVRGPDGRLLLMELEAIEPNLFPEQGPQIGPMLAKALRRRLG